MKSVSEVLENLINQAKWFSENDRDAALTFIQELDADVKKSKEEVAKLWNFLKGDAPVEDTPAKVETSPSTEPTAPPVTPTSTDTSSAPVDSATPETPTPDETPTEPTSTPDPTSEAPITSDSLNEVNSEINVADLLGHDPSPDVFPSSSDDTGPGDAEVVAQDTVGTPAPGASDEDVAQGVTPPAPHDLV